MHTTGPRRRSPRPGRPTRVLILPILVQLLLIAVLLLDHPITAAVMAAVTIVSLALIHRSMLRRIRDLTHAVTVANTDMVTGLPTRRLIYQHLTAAAPTRLVTVVFADVDDLKPLNDTYGHHTGDDYLAAIAARLQTATNGGDVLVRLGGDEFALATHQPADHIAARLAKAFSAPATIGVAVWPLQLSIGIYTGGGGDPHTALGRAEAAMYFAKHERLGIAFYDPSRDGDVPPVGVRPRQRRRDQPTPPAAPTVVTIRRAVPPLDAT